MPPKKAPYYGRKSRKSISTAKQRQAETEEQREQRLKRDRMNRVASRASESVKERDERLKKQRDYVNAMRAEKRQKQRRLRILQQKAHEAATRKPEEEEEEEQRREVILNFNLRVMDAKTEEQHEEQLSDAAESVEQREERLNKQRGYRLIQCSKKSNTSQCLKVEPAIVSSENDTLQELTAALELQTKQLDEMHFLQKNQFENTYFETRQISAQVATPSTQVVTQPASRHVQDLAPLGQIAEPKPVQKHQHQLKIMLVISNHQQLVMSNLSSLWKNRKLCDAAISNGTSTIKVHKVVLSAVCPKLLSRFSTDILSQHFIIVNFPKEVSTEALNAFAEYMYNGILDLDRDILKHLKIIAKKLDMKEFEQLCDSHIPKNSYQSADAANLSLIQKVKSVPAMTSLLASLDSPVYMDSTPSVTTQVVDINQESMETELGQVKMETGHMFDQEIEVESLASNKCGNDICPNIKTEPVGPDDNKYGYLSSSSSNQVFTSTTSSSPSSLATTAASTSISSVPASSTKFPIPFTQSTDVKSTRLKASPSYETPLASDLSPISRIVETVCTQPSAMNEDSSKQLNRQSISTSSVHLPSTSNAGIYPVALFMAGGDNLPLLTPNAKSIDLCKTDLT